MNTGKNEECEEAENPIFSVAGESELMEKLTSMDIRVPPRGPERQSHHTERYSICRLLSTSSIWRNGLDFPLELFKQE